MNGTVMEFRGRSSKDFCMLCSHERALLPARRRSAIVIPRRSGVYDSVTAMPYEEMAITVHCLVRRDAEIPLRETLRQVSAWLSEPGELSFDAEPGRYYTGRVCTQTEPIIGTNYAKFDVVFYCFPFAHSKEYTLKSTSGSLSLRNDGTVESPCVIELTAPGESVRVTAGAQSFSVSGLTAGQLVRVNSEDYTCTVDGGNALHLMEGDFVTIPPRADFTLSADPPCALTLRYRKRWL